MNNLEKLIKKRIQMSGPINVAEFMADALGHPQYGYYITRDPFGRGGDFITAPEISQMFGEMIGAWAAHCWLMVGCPSPFHLVELGPGRGTLMADALRALAIVPGLLESVQLHLVETSPVLRERQQQALAGSVLKREPQWHENMDTIPEGPILVIANEFFDALPIRQFEKTATGWAERMVALDAQDELQFVLKNGAEAVCAFVPQDLQDAEPGSVFEFCPSAIGIVTQIAKRITADGIGMLVIDYGHDTSGVGETLQAVKGHEYVPLLKEVGQVDLTAHVDFSMLARAAVEAGAVVKGPIGQGDFLSMLGIHERANMLKKSASVAQSEQIDTALNRLVGDNQMGQLFRVMSVVGPGFPITPGLTI